MPDRRFEHVLAVVQHGSFTQAAEKVGMTQSGITKSVADLERELGYSLFHRTARGTILTERGREFAERASRLLDDARILLTGESEKDPYAKTLRIGVCPASVEYLLADTLVQLLRRHPSIRFEINSSSVERVIELLRNGAIDVAVGFEDAFAEWNDVKLTPIAALNVVLFARKGHPITKKAKVTKSDLSKLEFVSPTDSRPYGKIIRDIFEDEGLSWQRHIHVIDYFAIVKRIVAKSDAIGATTADYARTAAFKSAFERVPGEQLFPPIPMCCAIRSRWEPTLAVKAFLRVARERLPVTK